MTWHLFSHKETSYKGLQQPKINSAVSPTPVCKNYIDSIQLLDSDNLQIIFINGTYASQCYKRWNDVYGNNPFEAVPEPLFYLKKPTNNCIVVAEGDVSQCIQWLIKSGYTTNTFLEHSLAGNITPSS